MPKCPVCKSVYTDEDKCCINCGFDQLNKEFINQDELLRWLAETVTPCRKVYRVMVAKLEAVAQNSLQTVLQREETNIVDLSAESDDFQYFDYEEESGIVTHPYRENEKSKCPEIQRYVNKGIRITGYNGFEIQRVTVPSEINGRPVISIGEKVFMNTSLSEIILPKSLKAILRNAFDGCKNLRKINLPEGITFIAGSCFANSGLEEVSCPDSLELIPNSCFYRCKQLNKVHLGISVNKIAYFAFDGCENLSDITLPESLIEIEDACFADTAIKAIIIPQNVKKIHGEAFGGKLWEISAKHKYKIACVFLGRNTEIFSTVAKKSIFSRVSVIYCLPGSKIQKIAREHLIPIKPISEFRLENYQ